MRYFRHETREKTITLYPFVCWHVGAPQADYEFINEMVERLKEDPHGRGIYMGDGGECVTKSSKGQIYEQTMSPQEQLNWVANKLIPVKEKMLFGVKGNHGWRTFKDSGLNFDEGLCIKLGIPYFGVSAFWNLKVGRSQYDVFTHHGIDSGVAIGTKVMKAKKFEEVIIADAIMSAHSHICAVIPPHHRAYLESANAGQSIKWRTTHGYICGCAYDSRSGYAEDKGYPPILPAHIAITFYSDGKNHDRSQTYEIFHADANKKNQPNQGDKVSRMMGGEGTACSRHPEYRAIKQPQVPCLECWELYITKHGGL
jgi:hypothetical protein